MCKLLYFACFLKLNVSLFLQGKFLQTYAYNGDLYGLSLDAIDEVAKEGLACIIHMEIEGVLVLKLTHFEPRYVFLCPLDRLVSAFSSPPLKYWVQLVRLKRGYFQDFRVSNSQIFTDKFPNFFVFFFNTYKPIKRK